MTGTRIRLCLVAAAGMFIAVMPSQAMAAGPTAGAASTTPTSIHCAITPTLCTEVFDSEAVFGQDVYVGHDEPSDLFYSNRPGAGNNNSYLLQLPKDPPVAPNQAGTAGTDNFQLHPAFWFGMAMCDSQSAPNFTNQCTPDTDANIFDDANPASPKYIGRHPGTAFMEMQFYPPGWAQWPAGNSCSATQYCAALNIDSLSQDQNNGLNNNAACLQIAGQEPVNFAFITRNGRSQAPAGPVHSTIATFTPDPNQDLFMNPGDVLSVNLFDTPAGFEVFIVDLTSHRVGSMTASIANGFEQVDFQPTATTCSATPYAFHPMYSTSSEHTRVPWAAHSYNVAMADEIGHFEYCNQVTNRRCTVAGSSEADGTVDSDDVGCFAASSLPPGSVPISGCQGSDGDFDGPEYFDNWPGTNPNVAQDQALHAQPIRFTSPLFDGFQQFDRVAFEADLPRIESQCDRFVTGANCVNPPQGAGFYPFFTAHQAPFACNWQLGGAHIPGTTNTFGGSSTTEYGALLQLTYPGAGFQPTQRFNDFRQVLNTNPCRSFGSMG